MSSNTQSSTILALKYLILAVAAFAALLWAFWPTLGAVSTRWAHDPQYSHGYLVPVFALYLLWHRRASLDVSRLAPAWMGLILLGLGVLIHLVGAYLSSDWLDAISFIPCVAGIVLAVGGTAAWRWAYPAVGFLVFMIPLPYRLAVAMAGPLQRLATLASCQVLQVLGLAAVPEGNVILLNDIEIGIVEACSGLRMLVVFFALSTAVVLVVQRPIWEKIVLILSSVPIALFTNLVRITVTGVLFEMVGPDLANAFFHDAAGWLMMPFALALLGIELTILGRLLIEESPEGPVRLDTTAPPVARTRWNRAEVAS